VEDGYKIMSAEKIYWVRPDGGTLDLTDGITYDIRQGVDGRYMPPFEFLSDAIYTYPGEVLRTVKTKPREVTLPITVYTACGGGHTIEANLRINLRTLTNAFNPTLGEGKLMVVTLDSQVFILNCRYSGGMSLEESYSTGSGTFRMFVATFIAHSPYWWKPTEEDWTWSHDDADLANPQTVINNGDIEAWPVWTIKGPASSVTIRHTESGKYMTITPATALTANDNITIDTRPGKKDILFNNTKRVSVSRVLAANTSASPTAHVHVTAGYGALFAVGMECVVSDTSFSEVVTVSSVVPGADDIINFTANLANPYTTARAAVLTGGHFNYFKYLALGSAMFQLLHGSNQLSFTFTGGSDVSAISCRWVENYYGV